MMSKRDHAKIILLEHATAKSAVERIQGFLDTIASNANYQVINRAANAPKALRSFNAITTSTSGVSFSICFIVGIAISI